MVLTEIESGGIFPPLTLKWEDKMKDYYYNVNGTEFHDMEAFGEAWKKAKVLAREEHCGITRTVIDGGKLFINFMQRASAF